MTIPVEVTMIVKVRKLNFMPVGGVVLGADAARTAHKMFGDEGLYANVKCPKQVVFGPLPKTSTGKIQKGVLRDTVRGD